MDRAEPWRAAAAYHERTKHQFNRYARSAGHLDWANQPDPFRRYAGAPLIELDARLTDPLDSRLRGNDARGGADGPMHPHVTYDELFDTTVRPRALDAASISEFLGWSMAISAWKQYGASRWALRCNPSSGNLHPTEGYLVLPPVAGIGESAGLYHYAPREHALERRAVINDAAWAALSAGLPDGGFFVGLTSIHWREAWKYGERAYRYCQHDVGHALGALRLAAAVLGWRLAVLDRLSDADVSDLLGLSRATWPHEEDREHPDLLAAVWPATVKFPPAFDLDAAAIATVRAGQWLGEPNSLSPDFVRWDAVHDATAACVKPRTQAMIPTATSSSPPSSHARQLDTSENEILTQARRARAPHSAATIFRTRRSALGFDGRTALPREQFYLMLARTMPKADAAPFDALPGPTAIHLALFVHRVTGLTPGLYFLPRDGDEGWWRGRMRDGFAWSIPPNCPADLPLRFLGPGDCRDLAATISCHQAIAADGAFSLGMIARFEPLLAQHGAWFYRRLFWEAGLVGQVLYLEAEAAGIRATGIGCYFDDAMHEVLGLSGTEAQSMYHFTMGTPVDDVRLTTLPAYDQTRRTC